MSHISLQEQASAGSTNDATDQIRPTGVLVIEDERLMLKSLDQGLRKRGFAVWAAADGGEGVELYRRFGWQIDVVLSDLNMPVLDGPQTLAALREINPLVRFCFMTGDVRLTTLTRLLKLGALKVFTKPFPSVAEVAEELRGLATLPPDGSAALELDGEVVGHDGPASPEPVEPPGGGFFGTVFSPLVRSVGCIGLPWGRKRAQSPGEPPPA